MNNMKKTVIAMTLLLLTGAPGALAQNAGAGGATKSGGLPEAPIGHRQPTRADVPNEKNLGNPNDPISK